LQTLILFYEVNLPYRIYLQPLIKAKDKDKREIYAFQFTGTDENISKIERIAQQLFKS
jgi:hypothetical protein